MEMRSLISCGRNNKKLCCCSVTRIVSTSSSSSLFIFRGAADLAAQCLHMLVHSLFSSKAASGWVQRANDLSGFVARDLSGLGYLRKGVQFEADTLATGDSEDEIRRGIWGLAGGTTDARRSGTVTGTLCPVVSALHRPL